MKYYRLTDIDKSLHYQNDNVVYYLRDARSSVTPELIRKSWKNLWPTQEEDFDANDVLPLTVLREKILQEQEKTKNDLQMINDLLTDVFGEDITTKDVEEWVNDRDEEILTETEIIESVETEENEENEEPEQDRIEKVKHEAALTCFNTILKCCSENDFPDHQILLLKKMKEGATEKHLKALKQKTIGEFFKP
ncbi:hypothetical protein WA026_008380 [Henosepilachna vigintioctopunctata]|uniref:Uncharacterized protein n=1 Tax=Henosepilachna vigintioctopunctata TaxID=420089 RepID=A0AAW1UB42_9CUCU